MAKCEPYAFFEYLNSSTAYHLNSPVYRYFQPRELGELIRRLDPKSLLLSLRQWLMDYHRERDPKLGVIAY